MNSQNVILPGDILRLSHRKLLYLIPVKHTIMPEGTLVFVVAVKEGEESRLTLLSSFGYGHVWLTENFEKLLA